MRHDSSSNGIGYTYVCLLRVTTQWNWFSMVSRTTILLKRNETKGMFFYFATTLIKSVMNDLRYTQTVIECRYNIRELQSMEHEFKELIMKGFSARPHANLASWKPVSTPLSNKGCLRRHVSIEEVFMSRTKRRRGSLRYSSGRNIFVS